MRKFSLLIRCVGEAVVAQGVKCLLGLVPFAEHLYDIAHDAHERFKQRCQTSEALAQIEAAAQAPLAEVKDEVRQVVAEIRPQGVEPEVEKALVAYIEQVPAAIRATLRRPADPSGRTLPHNFSIKSVADFLRLLPQRPPRFHPGDRVLDNWVLSELLGVGGFAEVWKAEHAFLSSEPPVALKFCLDPEAIRFLGHEARLLDRIRAQGQRAGLVDLREVYFANDPPCLAYEFVNGGDLCGLMHDWLRLQLEKRVELAGKVILKLARIMGPLHRLEPPIVHRDLKPANVLVLRKENGRFDLKIADFGIGGLAASRSIAATSRGVSRGDLLSQTLRGRHTPLYASPEQIRGLEPDPRDDVHALGVIWFHLLICDLQRGVGPDFDEELCEIGVAKNVVQTIKQCVARKERRLSDAQALAEQIAALTLMRKKPKEEKSTDANRPTEKEDEQRQREEEQPRRDLTDIDQRQRQDLTQPQDRQDANRLQRAQAARQKEERDRQQPEERRQQLESVPKVLGSFFWSMSLEPEAFAA